MKTTIMIIMALTFVACGTPDDKSNGGNDVSQGDASNDTQTDDTADVGTADSGDTVSNDTSADTQADANPGLQNLPECIYQKDDPQQEEFEHIILRGESDDASVSFVMALCLYEAGVGHSGIYRADHFEYTWGDNTWIAETDEVEYINSHHNWADGLNFERDNLQASWRVRLTQENQYDHTFVAKDGDIELPETKMNVTCDECRNYQFVIRQ